MKRRRFLEYAVTGAIPLLTGCVSGEEGVGGSETTVAQETTLNENPPSQDETTYVGTSTPPRTTSQEQEYIPLTEHYFSNKVVYEHDQLRLHTSDNAVRPEGTIKFRITNTGDSNVSLGCHNPTTIQKQVDGEWRDVVWTSADAFLTCATVLPAGKTTTETVTISRNALETKTEKVRPELKPGQYRFVLLSTDPYLAVDFQVRRVVPDNSDTSSTASVSTSSRATEENQPGMCTTTPVTRGTAIYEGTTVPCENTKRTAETQAHQNL